MSNVVFGSVKVGSRIPQDETTDERVFFARRLAEDEKNPSLNVGPNGRPLFTDRY
ncbi:unnamed protein product [Dovyalis caffra]|uniref:Uncharacterized protein n=1 Tax=Dovyalis caffra TaxID=77055 RepID=A0AAV1SEQ3_9ROSI|nr:unnamed protein product [Dovyalis caffra]